MKRPVPQHWIVTLRWHRLCLALFLAVAVNVLFNAPTFAEPIDSFVQLPKVELSVKVPPVTGRTIAVSPGGDLQAAIDSARSGDEIVLPAGAVFQGSYRLRNHNGDRWITIRSAGPLPPENVRAKPSDVRGMATLISSGGNAPVLYTEPGAHKYYIIGLHITAAPGTEVMTALVSLGSGGPDQKRAELQPRDIVIDRSYIHGTPSLQLRRAVALNSASTAIINSTLDEVHSKSQDSQAICGWNGTGPYLIQNNRLEGSGENIMFGGADPHIPNALPSDITIRGNDISKPDRWRGIWLVKNLFELKLGVRVLIEKNHFENNWVDGQDGVAILLKSANDEGKAPWSRTAHITFRDNVIKNSPSGLSIAANPQQHKAVPASHFAIYNNVFMNIGGQSPPPSGRLFVLLGYGGALDHITIANNTAVHGIPHLAQALLFDGEPTSNLKFTGNTVMHGAYGIHGSGQSIGAGTIVKYAPGAIIKDNTFVGGIPRLYGATASLNRFIDRIPAGERRRAAPY